MQIFRYTRSKTSLPVQAGVPLYTTFDYFLTNIDLTNIDQRKGVIDP